MSILLYELVGADERRPFSPHCWKAAMALAHKRLDFRSLPTCFSAVPDVEGGMFSTVPVIRDGDRVVGDSFAIALYLEETYPDRPTLFGGEGGKTLARFVERWCQAMVNPFMGAAVMVDVHDCLAPEDQKYFRASREARNNGRSLESVASERDARHADFLRKLQPLRSMLEFQPFMGGTSPAFADYIVFGSFQWTRVVSRYAFLPKDDPINAWLERCLDLHDGFARRVPALA